MYTTTGDGDLYIELARLLQTYNNSWKELQKMSKSKRAESRAYKDFLMVANRLREIRVSGIDLAESGLIQKLLENNI